MLRLLPLSVPLLVLAACSRPAPEASAAQTVRFDVQGMTCDGCREAIAAKIGKIDGVASCEVSLESHEAVARVTDPAAIDRIVDSVSRMHFTIERKPDDPTPGRAG